MLGLLSMERVCLSPNRGKALAQPKPVYNITKYFDDHPGGKDVLLETAGTDASESFDFAGHTEEATSHMKQLQIGELTNYVRNLSHELLAVRPAVLTGEIKKQRKPTPTLLQPLEVGSNGHWLFQPMIRPRFLAACAAMILLPFVGWKLWLTVPMRSGVEMEGGWSMAIGFQVLFFVLAAAGLSTILTVRFIRQTLMPRQKPLFEYSPYFKYVPGDTN